MASRFTLAAAGVPVVMVAHVAPPSVDLKKEVPQA